MKTALRILYFLFLASAAMGEVTIGTDGAAERRTNGDVAYLPSAYMFYAGALFPSEAASFFFDLAARAGWDTVESEVPYDLSASASTSLRGETLFLGLSFSSLVFNDYENPGEWHNTIEGTLSFAAGYFSLYIKPSLLSVSGPRDSVSIFLEPGVDALFLSSLVGSLGVKGGGTRYSDGGRELSLEPKVNLDWYPGLPLTLSLATRWSRSFDNRGAAVGDTLAGNAGFLWHFRNNLILDLRLPVEREYFNSTGDTVLRFEPGALLRWTLPVTLGGADILAGAGMSATRQSASDAWRASWVVRLGVEKTF